MIGNDWDIVLNDILKSDKFKELYDKVLNEYKNDVVYPHIDDLFNAFKLTSFENTKVVIIGQDPYHGEGQAHGLSFSVNEGVKVPPSLKNIYKEIESDLGYKPNLSGNLTRWASDGVLLLNAVLTVSKNKPGSHRKLGWEYFTDEVVRKLNKRDEPIVFILWGNFAKEKASLITNDKHLILSSVHPSPFSARNGFFGSKVFSKTNEFLNNKNMQGINW